MKAKQFLLASIFSVGVSLFTGCEEVQESNTYVLNSETSVAEWKGATSGVQHTGSFAVTSNNLIVENNKVKSGSFVIPIASIKNFDLPDDVKPILLNHLKSEDFFNLAIYPEATFKISGVVPYKADAPTAIEDANYMVTGDFTMIGKTFPISFPAKITVEDDLLSAEAILKIDRTKWGMNYSSDPAMGDHYIYPEVDIHLKLFGNKVVKE